MLEREDFGAQTSSKSTKLVHGGVRYLEKAVFNLDYGQLKLVFEALHERKHMIENAPHLSQSLPIMTVSLLPAFPLSEGIFTKQPQRGNHEERFIEILQSWTSINLSAHIPLDHCSHCLTINKSTQR